MWRTAVSKTEIVCLQGKMHLQQSLEIFKKVGVALFINENTVAVFQLPSYSYHARQKKKKIKEARLNIRKGNGKIPFSIPLRHVWDTVFGP